MSPEKAAQQLIRRNALDKLIVGFTKDRHLAVQELPTAKLTRDTSADARAAVALSAHSEQRTSREGRLREERNLALR